MIPESVRKIVNKLELPYLSLEEQLKIAGIMESCRDKLIRLVHERALFKQRLMEKFNLEGDSSQVTHFTLEQVTKLKAKRMIRSYLREPSLRRALKLNLNYVFVGQICEEYLKKRSNKKIQNILHAYYEARDKLVNSMVKNVVSICQHYVSDFNSFKFEDVFQTAMLALIESTGRYSQSMGYKFDTFSTWWVRYELQHFMRKDNLIKIPFRHYTSYIANARKIQRQEQDESREIRNPIEFPQFKYDSGTGETNMPDPIFDYIADSRYKDEEIKVILKSILSRKLSKIDDKSREIMTKLFGIDCPSLTPKQVGIELDMSPRAVTYLARSTLRKLKLKSNIKFPK